MRQTLLALITLTIGSSILYSEDAKPDAKPWKNSTEASVASTNGNSKTTTTSLKNTFGYKWTRTGLEIIGGGFGSSSRDTVTAEQYFANEKITYNITERNYVYEKLGWDKNRFAGIRNRWDGSGGVGRLLLDFPNDQLNTELGGGYINEERIGAPRNDFASGRAYLKYVHKFTGVSSFSQDAEYLHSFKDHNDYRVNTESALIAALSAHFSLKTSFVWNHVNNPVTGTIRDDTKVLAGLIVNY